MLEEIGLLVTYITMGIAPIAYNFLNAKRIVKKGGSGGGRPKEGWSGGQGARGFTLTIPCGVGPACINSECSNVVYLNINSVSSSYVVHVKRVLSQG